jgi:hypothetical protein
MEVIMKKTRGFLLTVGILLATTFTLSCSSDKDDPPDPSSSSVGGGYSSSSDGEVQNPDVSSSSSDVGDNSSSSNVSGNSSSSDVGDNSSSSSDVSGSSSSSEETSVWLQSYQKQYTVTDGNVVGVYYDMNYTYTSYTDDKHYEYQYNYTIPYNTQTDNGTYTQSQIGSAQYSISDSRNGNTGQVISHQITNYTTTTVYVDERPDGITRTEQDLTVSMTYVYDEESGLMLSYYSTVTGTSNGTPVNSISEVNYTIVPLGTVGDVKIYRSYMAATATGAYSDYKMQNGINLETKSYTAEGVLSYTYTTEFPDNATIRAKLPTFMLYSYIYETIPANNSSRTCEVVSDSPTELTIRVKTYNPTTGALTGQTETTYTKRN